MKRLVNVKTVVGAVMAIIAALIFLTNKLDVWGFPLPASKASVDSLSLEVAENRQVIWTRAKRADETEIWDINERCKKQQGNCTRAQAKQIRRLQDSIAEAREQLERIKKGRQ